MQTLLCIIAGMFPYVMIAVMPIFCDADWPKLCISKVPKFAPLFLYDSPPSMNPSCIYSDEVSEKIYDESVSIFYDKNGCVLYLNTETVIYANNVKCLWNPSIHTFFIFEVLTNFVHCLRRQISSLADFVHLSQILSRIFIKRLIPSLVTNSFERFTVLRLSCTFTGKFCPHF